MRPVAVRGWWESGGVEPVRVWWDGVGGNDAADVTQSTYETVSFP